MKNIIALLLFAALSIGSLTAVRSQQSKNADTAELLHFLAQRLKYPEKARLANIEGSNVLLFTVKNGKLNGLKIYEELSGGCDLEVINAVLAYPNFALQNDGVYALHTNFILGTQLPEKRNMTIPDGYQLLKLIVRGYPADQTARTATVRYEGEGIVLRGDNHTDGAPLVMIDGVQMPHHALKTMDPKNVESITVLKSTSAIAKYGVEAVNGAISITTKGAKLPVKQAEGANKN